MRCFTKPACGLAIVYAAFALSAIAQHPEPSPTPDETVRIRTEEVHLTVHAQGAFAGVAPKLRPEDLGVYEDGALQKITSMQTAPARVLVLADTGAALTFAKSPKIVSMTIKVVLESMPERTVFSILQYSDRTDVVAPWTDKREEVAADVERSIKSGRRSNLSQAVDSAIKSFSSRPIENRHLILITDGLDGPDAVTASHPSFAQLAANNIVLHVISYTAIEQLGAKEAGRTVRLNTRPSRPRVPKEIFDDMIKGLPLSPEAEGFLRMQNEARQIVIIDLDGERKKMLRTRRGEWEKAEAALGELAIETGGSIRAPVNTVELLTAAAETALSIGMHYDITYMPSRIADDREREERAISVISRSDAIKVRARKKLMVKK